MSDIKNVVWERTLTGEPMRYWTAKTEAEAEEIRQNHNENYGSDMQLCTEEEWVAIRTGWNGYEIHEISSDAYYQLRDNVPPLPSMTDPTGFWCGEPYSCPKNDRMRYARWYCWKCDGKFYCQLQDTLF